MEAICITSGIARQDGETQPVACIKRPCGDDFVEIVDRDGQFS